mmetsp:Transcript_14091/g.55488  ORF Transcript_14091/g.55488 Transcript_14091/m.55488 type:complete len:229 (-) Transcript_14091:1239-1925(-)
MVLDLERMRMHATNRSKVQHHRVLVVRLEAVGYNVAHPFEYEGDGRHLSLAICTSRVGEVEASVGALDGIGSPELDETADLELGCLCAVEVAVHLGGERLLDAAHERVAHLVGAAEQAQHEARAARHERLQHPLAREVHRDAVVPQEAEGDVVDAVGHAEEGQLGRLLGVLALQAQVEVLLLGARLGRRAEEGVVLAHGRVGQQRVAQLLAVSELDSVNAAGLKALAR